MPTSLFGFPILTVLIAGVIGIIVFWVVTTIFKLTMKIAMMFTLASVVGVGIIVYLIAKNFYGF